MNRVIDAVTPSTLAVVWVMKDELHAASPIYKSIDYLVNGLLTSSKKNVTSANQVLLSESFGKPLYIFLGQEIEQKQFVSFVELLKKDLKPESEILVVDEAGTFDQLKKMSPPEIKDRFKVL